MGGLYLIETYFEFYIFLYLQGPLVVVRHYDLNVLFISVMGFQ